MKHRPVIYSLSNPPEDIEEAQKALDYLNEEIGSAERAMGQKKPEEFPSEEIYDSWFGKIRKKINHLYYERTFLETWVSKKKSAERKVQIEKNKQLLQAQVHAVIPTLGYKQVYGDASLKPKSSSEICDRQSVLKVLKKTTLDTISRATAEGKDLYIFQTNVQIILQPLVDILQSINNEMDYLEEELNTQIKDVKIQANLQNTVPQETLSKVEEAFNVSMSPFLLEETYWQGNEPLSKEIEIARYKELSRANIGATTAYRKVLDETKALYPGLPNRIIQTIAAPFNKKVSVMHKEMAFLRGLQPKPGSNELDPEAGLRLGQIKSLLGFDRTDMLAWLIDCINEKREVILLKGAELESFQLIKEYVTIIRHANHR